MKNDFFKFMGFLFALISVIVTVYSFYEESQNTPEALKGYSEIVIESSILVDTTAYFPQKNTRKLIAYDIIKSVRKKLMIEKVFGWFVGFFKDPELKNYILLFDENYEISYASKEREISIGTKVNWRNPVGSSDSSPPESEGLHGVIYIGPKHTGGIPVFKRIISVEVGKEVSFDYKGEIYMLVVLNIGNIGRGKWIEIAICRK